MTDRFSGAENVSSLSPSKAEHVRHSETYGFHVPTQVCGQGGVLCVLLKSNAPAILDHPLVMSMVHIMDKVGSYSYEFSDVLLCCYDCAVSYTS